MAAEYPLEAQPESLQRTVFAESLEGVLAACRGEAATACEFERGEAYLIETDEENEREVEDFPCSWGELFPFLCACHLELSPVLFEIMPSSVWIEAEIVWKSATSLDV